MAQKRATDVTEFNYTEIKILLKKNRYTTLQYIVIAFLLLSLSCRICSLCVLYTRYIYTAICIGTGANSEGRWGWLLGFSVRARSPCRKHGSLECS